MSEYARRNFDPETVSKRYCRLCGHKLAERNEGGTCFRHLADDVAQEKKMKNGRGIRDIVAAINQWDTDVQSLLMAVCAVWRVSLSEILGSQHRPKIIEARNVAIFMLIDRDGMAKSDVAEIFQRSKGGLDYSLARIRAAWETDAIPDLKEKVRQVEEMRREYSRTAP